MITRKCIFINNKGVCIHHEKRGEDCPLLKVIDEIDCYNLPQVLVDRLFDRV
jgi:hypothetical protein